MDQYNSLVFSMLEQEDAELAASMRREFDRQQHNIELIASENIVSSPVLAAAGSVLTNKYAEGYPNRRYYGGCQFVDEVEQLAIDRAKQLFGAEYANVQPHSGSQANLAVYAALLQPGDRVLGMDLNHGGHLTHGSRVNASGKLYDFIHYGCLSETGTIDYEALREAALTHHPKLIVAGASAYPRSIDFERIAAIAKEAGALFMVDMAHIAGLVAAGEHVSPIPYADVVTTTTHKTLRGPRGGMILAKAEFAKVLDKAIFPGNQGGPLEHIIAAKALCFKEAMSEQFKAYQAQIVKNAKAFAEALSENGLRLVSGGTDNHLILIDLTETGLTGNVLEKRLDEVHITANKNAIPGDTQPPSKTSGLRVGTPAVTTRGFTEEDMKKIAQYIAWAVFDFEAHREEIEAGVRALCDAHPIYN